MCVVRPQLFTNWEAGLVELTSAGITTNGVASFFLCPLRGMQTLIEP